MKKVKAKGPNISFNEIEYKKPFYKVKAALRDHLRQYSRLESLPITYTDLLGYKDAFPLTDDEGSPTLWLTVVYDREMMDGIMADLVEVYQKLVYEGDQVPYLKIDRIDFCSFGNSKPFRIRVVNEINDNYDYFYVKRADASRVYGLELEEIFSPDPVNYLLDKDSLIEEHVVGIPVDEFILRNSGVKIENRLRLAKEFVKFNERCFVRLLGDMRAYNFVVEITQDFDNVQYRLRPMDFDQQSYEGRANMYKPQYYKDNLELVKLAQELMSVDIANQYMRMERVAMKKRYLANRQRTKSLLRRMKREVLSSREHVEQLKTDLAAHHNEPKFLEYREMGSILNLHLERSLNVQILTTTPKLR